MRRTLLQSVLIYAAAVLLAVMTLAPLAWLFIMSIMEPKELLAIPLQWLPAHPDFSRYARLLGFTGEVAQNPFLNALRNSLVAGLGSTLVALVVSTLAAYAVARREITIVVLMLMMATYMMPPITFVLPLYTTFSGFGLLNNPLTLVAVYCTVLIPFASWLMKANIDVLPVEVEQAAAIDGAGTFTTLTQVVLPMARPALLATGMLCFLIAWDEFFYALIFMSDLRGKTLPVAIADFAAGRVTDYGLIAAVGVLASLPPALVAVIFQKHLVSGLAAGSVKG
jgi:multiple sugar transport system permease protein